MIICRFCFELEGTSPSEQISDPPPLSSATAAQAEAGRVIWRRVMVHENGEATRLTFEEVAGSSMNAEAAGLPEATAGGKAGAAGATGGKTIAEAALTVERLGSLLPMSHCKNRFVMSSLGQQQALCYLIEGIGSAGMFLPRLHGETASYLLFRSSITASPFLRGIF